MTAEESISHVTADRLVITQQIKADDDGDD